MTDVKGWEDSRESAQRLFTSLYNEDKEGTWRMDVNVELCEGYDSDNDGCDGSDDKSSSNVNGMSEEEEDSDDSEEGLSDVSESNDGDFTCSDEYTMIYYLFITE